MPTTPCDLPVYDLGAPGAQRDHLITCVLSGAKTATTSLLAHWHAAGEELPTPGDRYALVDSTGWRGTIEIVEVRLVRLGDVDDAVAHAEGEGFSGAADWRAAHEAFWVEDGGDGRGLVDAEVVVVEFFVLVPTDAGRPSPRRWPATRRLDRRPPT